MKEIVIYTDFFDKEGRDKCIDCSASGRDYRGMIPFPICKVARLENDLGKKPTYGQAEMYKVNTSSIPEGCPNGYLNPSLREMR